MRRAAAWLIAPGLAFGPAPPALAQAQLGIEQIAAAPAGSGAEQVSREPRAAPPPVQLAPKERAPGATGQLAPSGPKAPAPSQLSAAGESRTPATQLTTARPTAEGPAPLSSPAQGRTAEVARVEGQDRCDPARWRKGDPAAPASCARILERRAGEFEPPRPAERTPEERLLDFQRPAADTPDANRAARRLAEGEVEGSWAAQAAALGVSGPAEPQPPPDKAGPQSLSPEAQALIEILTQRAPGVGFTPTR